MAPQHSDLDVAATRLDLSKKSRGNQRMQRIETAIRSFRVLRGLSPEEVDSFMNSYVIYDLDWADEKMMIETLGPDYQKKVGACLADYYKVLNHLCAIGELEKMYIPPAMDLKESITMNQILYEESIAKELHLPPNAKILDLGCGRGRVAAHISRITGNAQVTGLNIDADQIASAKAFDKAMNLSNNFITADFNDLPLPFPDNYFDAFYQIQAFSLAKDHAKLCRELYRVLRPGARLSLLDWASLEAYNPEDPHHQKLMRRIKPLIGAVGTPTPHSMEEALESSGFVMLESNNASIDGLQAPLIERADGYFRTARKALLGLVRVGLLPAHFRTLFNRLTQDCDAFVEADRARLITTSYHWLAEKPLTASPAHSEVALHADSGYSSQTAVSISASPAGSARAVKPDA
ncbi:related to SAM-dependent methyltransferases [Lecanosticta acicola]|uniref:Related to SAM-dependent methyltransferases n=1 Tax=Lecanosticta acicola TaxID=111012 RepID=A0AAI8YWS3_9PEZI|nr:related to SAM-dependent methyltransferases [Lecanosticta acicola]